MYFNIAPLDKIPLSKPQEYTYLAPADSSPQIGEVWEIPLYRKITRGVVLATNIKPKSAIKYKEAIKPIFSLPVLTEKQIKLGHFLSFQYHTPLGPCLREILPPLLKRASKQIEQMRPFNLPRPNQDSPVHPQVIWGDEDWQYEFLSQSVKDLVNGGRQAVLVVPSVASVLKQAQQWENDLPADKIIVLHSGLAAGEFLRRWFRIKSGEGLLIIGTRQAVFAPFNNLGAVIIGEENNSLHKQWDMAPRYDAREVALQLSRLHGASLYFLTLAPSISLYYRIQRGWFELVSRQPQPQNSPCAARIIDVSGEKLSGLPFPFSWRLLESIEKQLQRKKQVILYVNRRGLARMVICRDCGEALRCSVCQHNQAERRAGIAVCLYCGQSIKIPALCPNCSSPALRRLGVGTGQVALEVRRLFPKASVAVLDQDKTKSARKVNALFERFRGREIDILVGTQPVLNFAIPNCLLAAVSLDTERNFFTWNTQERFYNIITSLLSASRKSKVLLQTHQPEHPLLQLALRQDYLSYYRLEIKERRQWRYPPYAELMKLILRQKQPYKLRQQANKLIKSIQAIGGDNIKILGPHLKPYRHEWEVAVVIKLEYVSRRGKPLAAKEINYQRKKILDLIPSDWIFDRNPETLSI